MEIYENDAFKKILEHLKNGNLSIEEMKFFFLREEITIQIGHGALPFFSRGIEIEANKGVLWIFPHEKHRFTAKIGIPITKKTSIQKSEKKRGKLKFTIEPYNGSTKKGAIWYFETEALRDQYWNHVFQAIATTQNELGLI